MTDRDFTDFITKAQRPFGRSIHMRPVTIPDPAALARAAGRACDHWDTVMNVVVPKAVEAALNIRLGLKTKSANAPVEHTVCREQRFFPNLPTTSAAYDAKVEPPTPRPGFAQRISQLQDEPYRVYIKRLQHIADTECAKLTTSERALLAETKKAAVERLGELAGWPKLFDCVYDGPAPTRQTILNTFDRRAGESDAQWRDRLESLPQAEICTFSAGERSALAGRISEVRTLAFRARRQADRDREVQALAV
jgi:hypothetical protein